MWSRAIIHIYLRNTKDSVAFRAHSEQHSIQHYST